VFHLERRPKALAASEEGGICLCAIGEENGSGPTRWREAKKPACREKGCCRIVPSPGGQEWCGGAGQRRAVGSGLLSGAAGAFVLVTVNKRRTREIGLK
jgi:hypothetical protein